MKRYVVTEEELENLAWQAQLYGGNSSPKNMWKAEDACRSRPVPEWATHFAGGWTSQVDPMDVGLSPYWEVEQCEEMPK